MCWLRSVAPKNTKALGCQPAAALPAKECLARSRLRTVSQQGVGVPLVSCGERAEMPLKYLQLPEKQQQQVNWVNGHEYESESLLCCD